MNENSIINLDEIEFTLQGNGDQFEVDIASVANRIGADRLGYRIARLQPGKCAFPLHAHYGNEEMFFILEGKGEVRMGEVTRTIRKGDFIAAPADPECAHQIMNSSDGELIYLCVSTMNQPDVTVYPESDKIGVIAGNPPGRTKSGDGLSRFYKREDNVGYWKDESR